MKQSKTQSKKDLKSSLLTVDELEGGSKDNEVMAQFKDKIDGAANKKMKKQFQAEKKEQDKMAESLNKSVNKNSSSNSNTKCIVILYGLLDIAIFVLLAVYEWHHRRGN